MRHTQRRHVVPLRSATARKMSSDQSDRLTMFITCAQIVRSRRSHCQAFRHFLSRGSSMVSSPWWLINCAERVQLPWIILFYKITKIARGLWLAERSVCMRVCKHGSGVKMFCFSNANHASTNLKNFSSSKLDKFSLFTHSFVGWNLKNRYKEGVSIFLR